MVGAVRTLAGSLTYASWGDILETNGDVRVSRMINAAGKQVEVSAETVSFTIQELSDTIDPETYVSLFALLHKSTIISILCVESQLRAGFLL